MEWITGIAAIIALIISAYQINLSNKHALFERRLNAYLKVKWLAELCKSNADFYDSLSKVNEWDEAKTTPGFLFTTMTNCIFLEEMQTAIYDDAKHKRFLIKTEELRNLCEEVTLIFPNNLGHSFGDFVFYYHEMLVDLYKYKKFIDSYGPTPYLDNDAYEKEKRYKTSIVQYTLGTFSLANRLVEEQCLEKARKKIKLR